MFVIFSFGPDNGGTCELRPLKNDSVSPAVLILLGFCWGIGGGCVSIIMCVCWLSDMVRRCNNSILGFRRNGQLQISLDLMHLIIKWFLMSLDTAM